MKYLRVKNWDEFQHYKDRSPPWIKLHRDLLTDYDFLLLPDIQKGHLMMLWLLASQMDGRIPYDPQWVAQRIGATSEVDLDALIEPGWLIIDGGEQKKTEKWPSRYISAQLKTEVMERDNHKCVACGSASNLEIDHVTPVSQGGASVKGNLQVLCRSCNRSKRTKSAEHFATQMRSPEERRGEAEAEESAPARATIAEPTSQHRALAASLGLNCDGEWASFNDRVIAKGKAWFTPAGKGAAFSNWLRQERKFAERDGRVVLPADQPKRVAM